MMVTPDELRELARRASKTGQDSLAVMLYALAASESIEITPFFTRRASPIIVEMYEAVQKKLIALEN